MSQPYGQGPPAYYPPPQQGGYPQQGYYPVNQNFTILKVL